MDAPRRPRASPRDLAARLPLEPGVYRFRDAAGHVLYLGRAASLRRRVASYWGDLGDRRHLAAMVARIADVEAVMCDSAHEAAWLERNLLERHKPPWNRSPSGGQEAEVWIRLSGSARAPGLTVVYRPSPADPARHFGPYLGGQKVRDAVSGLCRVLPLGYAMDRSVGTERDMARLRGASPGARAGLVCSATAVLDRDPAAVAALRAELAVRRDAAAARLAFEFAARLQEELEALDWITAKQKVTQAEPSDFDVHGWADGVLVQFEVRGGRLSGWSQRGCGAAAAGRHLAETLTREPRETQRPAWADWARRNAELAARLRCVLLSRSLGPAVPVTRVVPHDRLDGAPQPPGPVPPRRFAIRGLEGADEVLPGVACPRGQRRHANLLGVVAVDPVPGPAQRPQRGDVGWLQRLSFRQMGTSSLSSFARLINCRPLHIIPVMTDMRHT